MEKYKCFLFLVQSQVKSILVKIICPSFSNVFTIGTNLNIGGSIEMILKVNLTQLPNVVTFLNISCKCLTLIKTFLKIPRYLFSGSSKGTIGFLLTTPSNTFKNL